MLSPPRPVPRTKGVPEHVIAAGGFSHLTKALGGQGSPPSPVLCPVVLALGQPPALCMLLVSWVWGALHSPPPAACLARTLPQFYSSPWRITQRLPWEKGVSGDSEPGGGAMLLVTCPARKPSKCPPWPRAWPG